ncbi:hypothetical protein COB11_05165 [Candidatus Aerophobetes bacterium]|uniref:Copper oxidase n=1 Tax=Aerophobetes bacterium TaxID=2030807 RepID=A0A2A4YFF9_UNCAE|nr:MAG: hypothetical protein COB11_05165 [Candidatus Aerophobetes bacterium]
MFLTRLFLTTVVIAEITSGSLSAIQTREKLITPKEVYTPGVKNLGYKMVNGVKVFRIEAEPVVKTIYNEKDNQLEKYVKKHNRYTGPTMSLPFSSQKIDGWGYNKSIPGPTIIVNEGDEVRIYVKNKLPEPTTIHWHGLIVPNNEDGAGGADDPVIKPGNTGVYHFTIKNPPGTYAYHSGFNDPKQVGMGMSGFFIVLPKGGSNEVKYDFAIMVRGWSLKRDGTVDFLSMANDWFTFNGLCAPNFPVLKVPYGARVKIRFGNMGGIMAHPIHLHGYSFNITGTEGGPIPLSAQWPAATVPVFPGTTRTIEFVANNPGLWRLHCHILHHIINDPPIFEKNKPIGILPVGGMYTCLEVGEKE